MSSDVTVVGPGGAGPTAYKIQPLKKTLKKARLPVPPTVETAKAKGVGSVRYVEFRIAMRRFTDLSQRAVGADDDVDVERGPKEV